MPPGDSIIGWADPGTVDIGIDSREVAEGVGSEDGSGVAGLFPSPDPSAAFNHPFADMGATTEDMSLWEEVYGIVDIGMDFDWNEVTRIAIGYGDDMGGL